MRAGGDVSRETLAAIEKALPEVSARVRVRLTVYLRLLMEWSQHIRLVGCADPSELWARHGVDCLQLLPLLPAQAVPAYDLGSGAGLPGAILAIVTERPFTLVEPNRRKAAFLREVARATGAPLSIRVERAENLTGPPAKLITARALAPLPRLLSWCAGIRSEDTVCLFPKGSKVADELAAAELAWNMTVEHFPSRSPSRGTILRLSRVMPQTSPSAHGTKKTSPNRDIRCG